jgi:hypothetical protein
MSARVQLDLDSVAATRTGSIVGRIWLEVEGFAFPEVGWHDFPVPILTWWIEVLRELVTQPSDKESLRFMDGPFEVRLEDCGSRMRASFVRSGATLGVAEVDPAELLTSALQSAEALVSTLERQGVGSSDIGELTRVARRPPGQTKAEA